MKIFKFVRVLLQRGWRWLLDNEFFEAIFGMACLLSVISAIMLLLGCIARVIGIQTANSNILECGAALLTILIVLGSLCGGIWSGCVLALRMFRHLRKVWKEL